jgi:DNA-binding beta-propeller fold protein YncE
MQHLVLLACAMLFPAAASESAGPKVHKIAVGGEGGWDYLTVDSQARRLYVSRGNRVVVVDLDKETVVGELPDTPGIHGIAIVPELNKGFTSNGSDSSVTVFDLKTLKAIRKIKASGTPDAILYDSASKRVFTFNHGTNDTTAIDPDQETVVGTLAFKAEPEAAVVDGKGKLYVNLRSSSEIAEVDAASLKILNRWPLAPGTRPTGLGFDPKNRRLFSACGNQKMVIMNADNGAVLGSVNIGRGADGCVFDPGKNMAYSSNGGDGTVTAVTESEPGKYTVAATIPTQASARTMTLDPTSHRLYLPAASVGPAPAGAAGQAKGKGGRRNFIPGSFVIVVVD